MRGRPHSCAERNLSDSLLMAAENQLRDKSHLDLTSREIAEAAGTHAGMVNYYFQGKDGLLMALLKNAAKDVDRHLDAMEAAIESGDDDPTERIVRGLIAAYQQKAAVISIFYIELFRVGSPVNVFYSEHREYNSVRIEKMIRKLVAKGVYRQDLDPVAVTWILLSLVIGPSMPMCPVQIAGAIGSVPTEVWIDNIVRMLRKDLLADVNER
ncbi:TetR/AcrR family transcriptional regulator [Sphingobium sp. AN558]|uniref:TetR/AcrR family transcriptional regulator n=2 Tax=Sphingobium TaxID=165695 RepID=UPI0030BCC890